MNSMDDMDSVDGGQAGVVVHRVHNVHTVHRFAGAKQSRALGVTARSTAGRRTLGFAGVTSGNRRLVFHLRGHVTLQATKPAVQPGEGRLAKRLEAASTLPEDTRLRRLSSSCCKRQNCTPRACRITARSKRPKARRLQESPTSANQSPESDVSFPRSPRRSGCPIHGNMPYES